MTFHTRSLSLALIMCAITGLISCTNSGRSYVHEGVPETLEVEILPNASKMFVYRIGRPMGPDAARMGMNDVPDGSVVADIRTAERYRRGPKPLRISEEKLLENVDYVVKAAGLCREGFFVIDRNLSDRNLWLKGECREDATSGDLHTFGAVKILDAHYWNKIEEQ